jgi:hypothetical protein
MESKSSKIKITIPGGKYSIIEARDTRREYPGITFGSSTEIRPFIASNFTAEGVMAGGSAISDIHRSKALEMAAEKGWIVEEIQ